MRAGQKSRITLLTIIVADLGGVHPSQLSILLPRFFLVFVEFRGGWKNWLKFRSAHLHSANIPCPMVKFWIHHCVAFCWMIETLFIEHRKKLFNPFSPASVSSGTALYSHVDHIYRGYDTASAIYCQQVLQGGSWRWRHGGGYSCLHVWIAGGMCCEVGDWNSGCDKVANPFRTR